MPPLTKNLGLIKAIHVGVNPPINTKMIWYNTTPGVNKHYYYDVIDLVWKIIGTNIALAPYKQFSGQLTGHPTEHVFIQWQNDINLASEPLLYRISEGVYRIETSTPVVDTESDFPVGYRSLDAAGCKSDGVSQVIVSPNLVTDFDNKFTFRVYDAVTNLLTDDFVISISVKTYAPPPEEEVG
jgi:hypothetical protein